ncbi:MAG: hypothetical protein PHY60_07835 [Atopobiaceae bacterium]|nr:hypothetical protein [Atopobiaceae bacterium]
MPDTRRPSSSATHRLQELGRSLDWRACVLVASVAACLAMGAFHEPWADEAQAWLLARDQSWASLLANIRYEGTPPGWHCLLKFLITLGLPYRALFLVPCAAVTWGTWLLLYRVEAPRWTKLLLPFSYFVLYQGGVIARSYSLVYPLLMLVVAFWSSRGRHPWRLAATLVALALACAQSMIVSGSLWLIWGTETLLSSRRTRKETGEKDAPRHAIGQLAPLAIVACCYLGIVVLVHTPSDAITAAGVTDDVANGLGSMLSWVFGACVVLLGDVSAARMGGALLIGLACVCYARGRRTNGIRFAVCVLPLLAFLGLVVCKPWHLAVLFYAIAAGLLLFPPFGSRTDDERSDALVRADAPLLRRTGTVTCAALLSLAVVATGCAGIYDIGSRYAAGSDVAAFLQDEGLADQTVCGLWYNAVDVEPYFDGALLANLGGRSGFLWSTSNGSWSMGQIEQSDPAAVVVDHDTAGSWADLTDWLVAHGYVAHEFEAHTYFQFGTSGDSGYTVYVRP